MQLPLETSGALSASQPPAPTSMLPLLYADSELAS